MKIFAGGVIILHMCTKNRIQISMVPEIQSDTDKHFCHIRLFFALLPSPTDLEY